MITPWRLCTISTSAGKAKSCCSRTHWDKRKEALNHIDTKRLRRPQQSSERRSGEHQEPRGTSRNRATNKLRAASGDYSDTGFWIWADQSEPGNGKKKKFWFVFCQPEYRPTGVKVILWLTASGKTSAADISDSCLSKQKMLPHLGQQHTLTTSRSSEINEPPLLWKSTRSFHHLYTAHCQQLHLKHFSVPQLAVS